MFQRVSLIVIFLISMGVELIIHRVRKKEPNLLNHIAKIIFDAITIVAGTLIAGIFLQVKEQPMKMIMILVAVIICFQIIIEIVNEPIKANKFVLSLLIILPILGVYYSNNQFKAIYNSEQLNLEKTENHGNYVDTTHKRKFNVRSQQENKLEVNQQAIKNYDKFFLISGKTTPNVYIYGENAITHRRLFLVKVNNTGKFTINLDKAQLAGSFKINLFVNNITLQNKGTVEKQNSASPDMMINLSDLSKQRSFNSGTYRVGKDLNAGDYVLLSNRTGSIQWLNGDNIIKPFNKNLYVSLKQNDTINVKNATLLEVSSETGMVNGLTTNGMLKVGTDILPGKYHLKATNAENIAKIYQEPFNSNTSVTESVSSGEVMLKTNDYIYVMNNRLIKQ